MRKVCHFWSLIFVMLMTAFISAPASAEKRVALIIGNSQYRNVAALPNPANDAESLSRMFKSLGFQVDLRRNLNANELRSALRNFTELSQNADVSVVYYAGHGIEVDDTNYLIPIDAKLYRDIDVEDETVSLDRVMKAVDPARRLRLVILDACRDNPFAKAIKRSTATRSIGRGLARVELAVSGTLVAYAARAGSTAADGTGGSSPFAAALLQHLATPGLDLRLALGRVRDTVYETTNHQQEPFTYGSLGGNTTPLVAGPGEETAAMNAPTSDPDAQMRLDYELAARIGSADVWNSFLKRYPAGFYSDLARAQRSATMPKAMPSQNGAAVVALPLEDGISRASSSEYFTERDLQTAKAIAKKNRYVMPEFNFQRSNGDVAPALRKFVGIWASRIGYNGGKGRQAMIIVNDVNSIGDAKGYLTWGPPTPQSFQQFEAGYFPFLGKIVGDTLRYPNAGGSEVKMLAENKLLLRQKSKGREAFITLEPIWRLVDAERSAKR